jgi:hypothetical protein
MLNVFGLKEQDVDQFTFMYYIADIFVGYVQNGQRTTMCDLVLTGQFTNNPYSTSELLPKDHTMSTKPHTV